jgi:hypothetical protein
VNPLSIGHFLFDGYLINGTIKKGKDYEQGTYLLDYCLFVEGNKKCG